MTRSSIRAALVAVAILGLAAGVSPLAADGMGLVQNLAGSLGVTDDQAIGGTKALLNVAKGNLGDDEFGQLLDGAPDLADLMKDGSGMAAGAASAMAGESSMADAAMGKAMDMAGGAGGLAALAGNADLIQQFSDLGMDAGMIEKFAGGLLDALGGGPGSGLMSPKTQLLRKGLGLL